MTLSRGGTLCLAIACAACATEVEHHRSIEVTAGSGTATVDGTIGASEWAGAKKLFVLISLPDPGGTTLGSLQIMNDATNLYLAFSVDTSAPRSDLGISFDADGSNQLGIGDDGIAINDLGFRDFVWHDNPPCPQPGLCGSFDTDMGGSTDGAGAVTRNDQTIFFELRHPLKSGDPHDVALTHGSNIGVNLSFRLITQSGSTADTFFPGPSGFFGLTIR